MSSPLDYLDAPGADDADLEQPMRELYAYRDGDRWSDGFVTGVRRGSDGSGAQVQFESRVWVPAAEVRPSSHYIAVLVNPDDTVYAEVVQAFADGEPADPIRDVSTTGDGNVGTEWRLIDEPRTGTRVRYRYSGAVELEQPAS